MYGLVLVISLAAGTSQNHVLGAYSDLAQCEAASQSHPSQTKCEYIDPDKGLVEISSITHAVVKS